MSRARIAVTATSGVLDDDGLERVAHVVAGVERPLQALKELLVLHQPDRVALGPEHLAEPGAVDPVALALQAIEQLAALADRARVLHAPQQAHARADRLPG